jgi:hypothetical protein
MNLLDAIKRIFSFQDWKEASSLPGWRQRPTRMKHARLPHSSSRSRCPGNSSMTIEEFWDKDERNTRFQELRTKGTPHVSRFSTVRNNRSLWCVVRP